MMTHLFAQEFQSAMIVAAVCATDGAFPPEKRRREGINVVAEMISPQSAEIEGSRKQWLLKRLQTRFSVFQICFLCLAVQ